MIVNKLEILIVLSCIMPLNAVPVGSEISGAVTDSELGDQLSIVPQTSQDEEFDVIGATQVDLLQFVRRAEANPKAAQNQGTPGKSKPGTSTQGKKSTKQPIPSSFNEATAVAVKDMVLDYENPAIAVTKCGSKKPNGIAVDVGNFYEGGNVRGKPRCHQKIKLFNPATGKTVDGIITDVIPRNAGIKNGGFHQVDLPPALNNALGGTGLKPIGSLKMQIL